MLHGELLVAWQRIPAQVVGDGIRSVRQLAHASNSEIEIWDGFPTGKPIVIDRSAGRDLATQNFTPDSILESGQIAKVHLACNSGLGGRTINVTEQVHPGIRGRLKKRGKRCRGQTRRS